MSSARYLKEWRLDTARTGLRRIPTGAARDRIRHWTDQHYSYTQISTAAGCSREAISQIAQGNRPTAGRRIVRGILAAQLGPEVIPDYLPVDATGTRRRLQAMFVLGHGFTAVARESQCSLSTVSHIANGTHPTVRRTTALAIARLYRRWALVPGPSKQARTLGAQRRWPGPMAWDRNIGDPAAAPDLTYAQAA